ncbi:14069_t:CDS:1, partial [Acaulospora colombiana]
NLPLSSSQIPRRGPDSLYAFPYSEDIRRLRPTSLCAKLGRRTFYKCVFLQHGTIPTTKKHEKISFRRHP